MVQGETKLRPATRTPQSSMLSRAGWPAWLAVGLAAAFTVLTLLVLVGATTSFDSRIIHALRPTDEWWGDTQKRYSPWMSRFTPPRMYLLLAVTSLVMSAWRRSWWPAIFGAGLAMVSIALTVLLKFAFRLPDPHGYVAATGGSYPSGHVVALVVCLGGCLLVAFPRVSWWMWLPMVAAAALLITGLLVAAAHWPSDILGGALLALALVSASSRLTVRRRATGVRPWET